MEFEDFFPQKPNIFTPSSPLLYGDERHSFWKEFIIFFLKSGFKHL